MATYTFQQAQEYFLENGYHLFEDVGQTSFSENSQSIQYIFRFRSGKHASHSQIVRQSLSLFSGKAYIKKELDEMLITQQELDSIEKQLNLPTIFNFTELDHIAMMSLSRFIEIISQELEKIDLKIIRENNQNYLQVSASRCKIYQKHKIPLYKEDEKLVVTVDDHFAFLEDFNTIAIQSYLDQI